ncbi:MAG: BamA/TamA family outer membrane protein, partial [Endomicrobiales bacterium]
MRTCLASALAAVSVCLSGESLSAADYRLPEVTVQETVISVSPTLRLYLPNGAVDLSLGRQYKKTIFEFSTRYDLADNFLGFEMDFAYAFFPCTAGIRFFDRVDFSEFYADREYLQRTQSFGPFLEYAFSKTTRLKTALDFERTYSDLSRTFARVDQGRNVVGEAGIWWDTLEEEDVPRGGRVSLGVANSLNALGSDYDYLKAEFNFRHIYYLVPENYFDCSFQAAFPVYTGKKPLTEVYTAGGYAMLRGYGFKEFMGDGLLYATVSYTLPAAQAKGAPGRAFNASLTGWTFFIDAAKVGGTTIFTRPDGIRSGAGAGLNWDMT